MIWRLIDAGDAAASFNMALDEAIAAAVRTREAAPTLRLYGWSRPSVSLGCFQRADDINAEYCSAHAIPVVRRPTGGRAILHGSELTYSFSATTDFPPFASGLLASYRAIAEALSRAFASLGIHVDVKQRREKGSVLSGSPLCFRSSSYAEILSANRKLVGSAQKRWPDALLQQGSIPYRIDAETMAGVFGEAATGCEESMVGLIDIAPDMDPQYFRRALVRSFEEVFGVGVVLSPLTEGEAALANRLEQEKYIQPDWTLRR